MAVPEMLPVLMNVEQVAEYLGLHKVTVLRFAREGKLPGFKVGREWRFRADEVREWVEARREWRQNLVKRFDELWEKNREEAEAADYGPEDVERVIERVRKERRASSGA